MAKSSFTLALILLALSLHLNRISAYPTRSSVGVPPSITLTPQALAPYASQSHVVIENGLFVNQVQIFTGTNITIRNSRFIYNSTSVFYRLLHFYGRQVTIENSEFYLYPGLGAPESSCVLMDNSQGCVVVVNSLFSGFHTSVTSNRCGNRP